jgi:hypothetical protein
MGTRFASAVRIGSAALSFFLVCCSSSTFAWGCRGHQTVADVAFQELNPHARAAVLALLPQLQMDPRVKHYCTGTSINEFVDVATWADDIREIRPETGPWHFIDVPLSSPEPSPNDCPSQGCLVTAINTQIATLRSTTATPQDRAMALLFLIHFVGDLHQPLHTTTNNDRGANCLPVDFFNHLPNEGPNEAFKPNLHGVWDTELVERDMSGASVAQFSAHLREKYATSIPTWLSGSFDLKIWISESHNLARTAAYGQLPTHVQVEAPVAVNVCSDDNHVSTRLAALHEVIDANYSGNVAPVIEVQLTKAGARLAAILNHIWE